MKITDLKTTVFKFDSVQGRDWEGHPHPAQFWGKKKIETTNSVTEVVTDERISGFSTGGDPKVNEILKNLLVGENPLDREKIWQKLYHMKHVIKEIRDIGIIDCALWDFAGRLTNLPVHKLMGGYREKVLAYASSMCGETETPCGLSTPDEFADLAEACVKRGYSAFKLHTFEPGIFIEKDMYYYGKNPKYVKMDVEACQAVRERVGDDIVLMLDACHDYNYEQALYVGRELEKLNFFWFEEPMLEYRTESYVRLCRELTIPICGPETLSRMGPASRAEWILRGASDMSRVAWYTVGGIGAAKKVADMCDAFGIRVTMHGADHGCLQTLGSIWNCDYAEKGLVHPLIDLDPYQDFHPYLTESPSSIDGEGFIHISQKPGLGWEFDWDFIRENTV